MDKYNKILNWIVIGILTVTLLSILYTSVVIYPPYAFLSYRNSQEKLIMVGKLIVPSIVVLICIILGYQLEKKITLITLVTISLALLFNIFGGIFLNYIDTTIGIYIICGFDFYLIPMCLILLIKDIIKFKSSKLLLVISSVVLMILYVIFFGMALFKSYIVTIGFLYLSLPISIMTNLTVYFNHNVKIYRVRTIINMYLINLLFAIYSITWHFETWIGDVIGIGFMLFTVALVMLIVFDVKKIINH